MLVLAAAADCFRLRALQSADWVRERVDGRAAKRPTPRPPLLLKCKAKYCRRSRGGFRRFRLRRRGKRFRFRGDGSTRGLVRSFRAWYRRFRGGLSRRRRRQVLGKFRKYLRGLARRRRRQATTIGNTRRWARRERGAPREKHFFHHHHFGAGPSQRRFFADVRKWIRRRKYTRRRRSRRTQWLKVLRRLRRYCMGNRRCLLFLKSNRPRSGKDVRRMQRMLRWFGRKMRRRRARWSRRKTGAPGREILRAEDGKKYYLPAVGGRGRPGAQAGAEGASDRPGRGRQVKS